MKLLFIDDDAESVHSAMSHLSGKGHSAELRGFVATEEIEKFDPDVVILDLYEGAPATNQVTGLQRFDALWATRFFPLVIYSARPDLLDEQRASHPYVFAVQKGAGSPNRLETALDELIPHVGAIRSAEAKMRRRFAEAVRDVAPEVFSVLRDKTEKERVDSVTRSSRRRLAALMDMADETALAAWEHYLCPPVSPDVKLGDVLRTKGGDKDDAKGYRVVLTPSCDLVRAGGRTPKVTEVLVAQCCSLKEGVAQLGYKDSKTLKKKIASVLTAGQQDALVPLPDLPGRFPILFANLRRLELQPWDRVDNAFDRVASLDSPFRERLGWAYVQLTGRPGVPDRDFGPLIAEMEKVFEQPEEKKGA